MAQGRSTETGERERSRGQGHTCIAITDQGQTCPAITGQGHACTTFTDQGHACTAITGQGHACTTFTDQGQGRSCPCSILFHMLSMYTCTTNVTTPALRIVFSFAICTRTDIVLY